MMEYSAGAVKHLLWFMETRETAKLLKTYSEKELRNLVVSENIYQQKAESRMINEFGCIKKRLAAIPDELRDYLIECDVNTAKQITIIAAMAADRLFYELMIEMYRVKLSMGEDTVSDADLNIFFNRKIDQSDVVANWTDAGRAKLKQTYCKYLIEAGLIQSAKKGERKINKPFIDTELRNILLRNEMEEYLYAMTGER